MRTSLSIVFFSCLLFARYAMGLELNIDLNRGKFSSENGLGISSYYDVESSGLSLSSWFFNASRSGYETEDTDGSQRTIWSQAASAGVGLSFLDNWSVDWSGFLSRTTETLFQQNGVQANLTYSANATKVPFSLGLGVGRSYIYQGVYFELFGNPIEREVEIDQSTIELIGSATFFEKLTIVLTGRTFLYSKTKDEFQNTFSSNLLNYYTADLIASIASLPEKQSSLLFIYKLSESWEGSLLTEVTTLIVDDSRSYRNEIIGTRYFEAWSSSIGLSRNEATSSAETIALFKLAIKI